MSFDLKGLKPPKYFSSIYLRFQSYDRFLLRFADQEEMENPPERLLERVRSCMIYFICKRPIIAAVPDSLINENGEWFVDISYSIKGSSVSSKVKLPTGVIPDTGGEHEVSAFPHKFISSFDSEGNLVVETLISNFVHLFEELPSKVKDLEILYIGKGTPDCAADRLDGHSTLQKILADIQKNEPDCEIALLLHNFKFQKDALAMTQVGELAEIRGDTAKEHYQRIRDYKPSIDEQSKLVEALLIDYFKTDKYNTHFTKGLSGQKVFDNFYTLDIDAIVVEFNNENIGNLNVYSQNIKSNYFHNILLDARVNEGRFSYFNIK